MTYAERQRARAAIPKPAYKISRGKKDITEYPDKAKPQTRRARFFDPESDFGKKSLVYQLKTGQLNNDIRALGQADNRSASALDLGGGPEAGDVFSKAIREFNKEPDRKRSGSVDESWAGPARSKDRGFRDARGSTRGSRGSREMRDSKGPRETRGGSFSAGDARSSDRSGGTEFMSSRGPTEFGDSRGPREPRESRGAREFGAPKGPREFGGSRGPRESREPRESRGPREFGDSRGPREFGDFREPREPSEFIRGPRESRELRARDSNAEDFSPRTREYPLSIPHTTAASQFLYGKSVVEAALRGGRRELYKLYIYRPSNNFASRREQYAKDNTPPDFTLENLAQEKGIKVVVLREEGLRVMDKMSGGRPHNNYVLEASPLPQRPVVSLGPLSEDAEDPGFSLNLGHQSAEEAALIKAPADFVATPAQDTHRPLVVVLHGVLDPGNVGAILRSASFLGATAVATTKRGSASMTPVVLKAAAGASEELTLFSVDSVERFLDESRANGWAVYAAVPPPPAGRKQSRPHLDMREVEETDPLAEKPCILLMGSEGEGLSRMVRKRADFDLNIPNVLGTSETIDSLNVSVAAGLLCNAFLRGKVHAKMEKERAEEKKFALW
ncbi:hypothetical protein B0H67DRAFT_487195 [Lasiosphaeris hirsuta]|uniref:rRNA methyltransferase 1, mitochondrial n=1 Tax=Lasiosphaeris hirsuta TaxID=260670 RepID=A0AA40ARB2_9PEZI|nr:hypothetical protein B0H67DRAFT_487195 [Lasiosphaeris hirsuta]